MRLKPPAPTVPASQKLLLLLKPLPLATLTKLRPGRQYVTDLYVIDGHRRRVVGRQDELEHVAFVWGLIVDRQGEGNIGADAFGEMFVVAVIDVVFDYVLLHGPS